MDKEEAESAPAAANIRPTADNEKQNVDFRNPHDLPFARKCAITAWLAGMTLTVTFGSSVFSSTFAVTAKEFNTTTTVMILGVSLYVLGFAVGPLFWGPVSEVLGRKIPIFTGYTVFAILQIPLALVHSLAAILVLRFLAGAFGAATIALVSAAYADFWSPVGRGVASAIYSVVCFVGPCMGPIIGVYITENLGWRWTSWITLIMAGFFGVPAFLVVPETYVPVLKREPRPELRTFLSKYLVRPVAMLRHEVMLDVMTLYCSLVYGIQYLTFFAIPYIFRHDRSWPNTTASLPFLSMLLGITTASIGVSIFYSLWYQPRFVARGKVCPEDRLPPVILGSFLLPIGLFWLAWTSDAHWAAQVIPIFFVGAGIMLIFAVGVVYIIDIYLPVSASAIAANTCIRSAAAAGLPLAAPSMYENLGTAWATSLLGFLTLLLIPAPFLFYRYGEHLRSSSKFAVR